MSNGHQETVADIVAEMRAVARRHGDSNPAHASTEWVYEVGEVYDIADRIEAAAKCEVARLRAALKPVLECKVLGAMTAEVGPGESEYCSNIIFKAQRIYNEGEAK